MKLQVTPVYQKTATLYESGEYRQIVSMGGSRSSKSWSILQLFTVIMLTRENIRITCWRNEKVTCRSTILEDFKNILYSDLYLYNSFIENKAKGSFTCKKSGSVIVFEGADSVGKVLGMTQHISFFNEVTEFNKAVYLQITQRTAETIFCDYNPSKNFWLEDYKNHKDTKFIHSDFSHNPFCPPNIVSQLKGYEPWISGSYKIEDGLILYQDIPITDTYKPPRNELNFTQGTADEYMWLVYGLGLRAEKPNRIYYGWKTVEDVMFDKLPLDSYFGLDFGMSRPNALVEVKYDGEKTFYIKELLYIPTQELEDGLSQVIDAQYPHIKKNQSLLICDSAKKSMVDGLVADGFMAVNALKGAGSVEEGISFVQSSKIVYTKFSQNLEKEYDEYSWALDRYNLATDMPVKKGDHLMDSIRYALTYLKVYLDISV